MIHFVFHIEIACLIAQKLKIILIEILTRRGLISVWIYEPYQKTSDNSIYGQQYSRGDCNDFMLLLQSKSLMDPRTALCAAARLHVQLLVLQGIKSDLQQIQCCPLSWASIVGLT